MQIQIQIQRQIQIAKKAKKAKKQTNANLSKVNQDVFHLFICDSYKNKLVVYRAATANVL